MDRDSRRSPEAINSAQPADQWVRTPTNLVHQPSLAYAAAGRKLPAASQVKVSVDVNSAETIEQVPIHTGADGVVRVAGTRVTLDTIVAAFDAGATAEEIARQYSSAPLPDVCAS